MIKVMKELKDFVDVVNNDKLVLVDFNATWCGPCRMMGRTIEEIQDDFKEITFLKVDTDQFPQVAQKFGVMSIPTMVAFKNGQRIRVSINGRKEEILLGAYPEDNFRAILKETFDL